LIARAKQAKPVEMRRAGRKAKSLPGGPSHCAQRRPSRRYSEVLRRYSVTLSDVVPTTPPDEAEIVVLPIEMGVANPALLMIATEVLLEVQDEVVVTSPTDPSEKVAVAVNCCV